eukprot:g29252.t1
MSFIALRTDTTSESDSMAFRMLSKQLRQALLLLRGLVGFGSSSEMVALCTSSRSVSMAVVQQKLRVNRFGKQLRKERLQKEAQVLQAELDRASAEHEDMKARSEGAKEQALEAEQQLEKAEKAADPWHK